MEYINISKTVKRQITAHIEDQDFDLAELLITEYLGLFKTIDFEIAAMQSTIYLLKSQYKKCISYLLPLCDSFVNSDLYYNLATAYQFDNNYQMAILCYRKSQLTSFDKDFRWELTDKIARLIYHDQSKELIEKYLIYLKNLKIEIFNLLQSECSLEKSYLDLIKKNPFSHLTRSIFIGTMEIANHIAQYTTTFRKMGMHVFSLNYYPNYLKYENDLILNLPSLNNETKYAITLLNALDIISEFDVLHLMFNMTLMPNHKDLFAYKPLKKRVFMHNLGSEIRIPSIAKQHHPYWHYAEHEYLDKLDETIITNNIKLISNYIDNVIVNDFEMLSYIKPYYKNIYMIGLPIALNKYPYSPTTNDKLLLVHAPTNPAVKGSEFFLRAIDELKADYDFDFIKVQGYSHEDAKAIYKKADIILDELIIGTYGSLTIESMSMGKCVVTYLSDSFQVPHGVKVPVQIANINNVKEKIKELLDSNDLRQELSIQGRTYVETYCDVNIICNNLIKIYEGHMPPLF